MKSKLSTLLIFVVSTAAFGQITTTTVAPKAETEKMPYDSTENYLDKELYRYLGQELYVNGFVRYSNNRGYRGFVKDYKKDARYNNRNIYKCCDDDWTSKYDELVGKFFKVIEIIDHPKGSKGLFGERCYLKLQERESGDIVYYEHNGILPEGPSNFPFIVVGFFEKQKQLLVGEKIIFSNKVLKTYDDNFNTVPKTDIETGEEITIRTGDKWTCIDLTIEEKYHKLSLIVQNSLGEKILVAHKVVYDRLDEEQKREAYLASEADAYNKKVGDEIFNIILQGKVQIRMSKEMCKLSWGPPKKINKTTRAGQITEQWVYLSNYLYFDNNILTAIQ